MQHFKCFVGINLCVKCMTRQWPRTCCVCGFSRQIVAQILKDAVVQVRAVRSGQWPICRKISCILTGCLLHIATYQNLLSDFTYVGQNPRFWSLTWRLVGLAARSRRVGDASQRHGVPFLRRDSRCHAIGIRVCYANQTQCTPRGQASAPWHAPDWTSHPNCTGLTV